MQKTMGSDSRPVTFFVVRDTASACVSSEGDAHLVHCEWLVLSMTSVNTVGITDGHYVTYCVEMF